LEITQQSERDTYHAIVLAQNATELLLTRADARLLLPSVEVPRCERIAENLTAEMKSKWGCEAVCLFAPDAVSASRFGGVCYQVLECLNRAEVSDAATEWVPIASLSESSFQDSADYLAVQQSVAECGAYSRGIGRPFAQLGWFRELQTWAEEVIGPLGLHLTGPFCQFNASPSFNLIRFETDGPATWFKAVGEPNLREFPITLALAQLFPRYLPQVLGTRPAWNGWLTSEIEGKNLGETPDVTLWKRAAADLARLQIESIERHVQLRDLVLRDLRTTTLSARISPVLDVMARLMDQQIKVPPPVLSRQDLAFLGDRLHEAVCSLQELSIPDTLGHLDLNPGNIIVTANGCVFLDWAEACIGHPFFSFEYLLEHFRREVSGDPGPVQQLITSYTAQWKPLVSSVAVDEALAVAPLLAVFAYAAGSGMSSDQAGLREPKTAGYLRGLARRMSREANQLIDRRSRCTS
jgi:Phosphotransferase enzyme family